MVGNQNESRTDTTLYNNIANYLLSNNLTSLSKDSLHKNIKDDTVLKKIIEKEGFKVNFNFRMVFKSYLFGDKEGIEKYEVIFLAKKKLYQNYSCLY